MASVLQILFVLRVMFRVYVYWSGIRIQFSGHVSALIDAFAFSFNRGVGLLRCIARSVAIAQLNQQLVR